MPGPFQLPQDAMVSTEGPQSMGSAYNPLEILKRLFMGGGEDIELPNESGMVDPRIPPVGANLLKSFRQANQYAGERAGGTGAIDALRKVGSGR